MVNNFDIISLDIETTGLEVGKHVPISIGAVKLDAANHTILHPDNSFYVQLEWDSLIVDPKALQINKLNIADPPRNGDLWNRSLPARDGIEAFVNWVGHYPWLGKDCAIAMGKNVGSFDLPMLKSVCGGSCGKCSWPFSYRSIDLNTMFFVLSDITGRSFDNIKNDVTHIAWGRQRDLCGNEKMKPHHAIADAWWNVFAYKECIRLFQLSGVPVA